VLGRMVLWVRSSRPVLHDRSDDSSSLNWSARPARSDDQHRLAIRAVELPPSPSRPGAYAALGPFPAAYARHYLAALAWLESETYCRRETLLGDIVPSVERSKRHEVLRAGRGLGRGSEQALLPARRHVIAERDQNLKRPTAAERDPP